ncbi:MAG TPA: LysR family transcriptional regulator [Steroidobacteraceae bacterium]
MELNSLKRFIAAAEAGSLGKAAEALSISQPGLSKSIRQLELDFGGKLLDRNAKGVTLTAFGKTVYVRAKRILAEWRHLDNERVALFNGLVGHITVGIARGTGFLGRVIPAVSARLSNERYAVHLTVVSGVAGELTQALRLGDLDFAVAVLEGVKTDADLVQEVLFYDRCGLFADARHPLAGRATSGIRDLAAFCWLCSSDAEPLREALVGLAHGTGVAPRKTLIDSNSVVYLISTLIGSDFVGLLPMDAVEDAIDDGRLVELVLDPEQRSQVAAAAVERPVGFLRRADSALSPVALAFQDEIRSHCLKLGYPLVSVNTPRVAPLVLTQIADR